MEEIKQRINADIPIELYSQLKDSSLSITDTVIKGIEQALAGKDESYYNEQMQSKDNIIKSKDEIIQKVTTNNGNLEREKKELQKRLTSKDNQILKLNAKIIEEENNKGLFFKLFNDTRFIFVYFSVLAIAIVGFIYGLYGCLFH